MSDLQRPSWQENILAQIFHLKANALPEATYDQMLAQQAAIMKPNRDYLTWKELNTYYDIEDQLEQSRIRVQTLPEFRFVLKNFGFQPADLKDALTRRNANVNVAEQFNATFKGYLLNVSKRTMDGQLMYILQAEVDIDIPDDWPDKRANRVARYIVLAPLQHGAELLATDYKLLARLER